MSKVFPIHIEQTPEGDYLLTWTEDFAESGVDVRAHAEPGAAASAEPVARGARPGVRVAALPGTARTYFHLQPEQGEGLTAAERNVPLQGGTNFRDMGGYRAGDGRRVRWGRLFRSGHSAMLSERDAEVVGSLDIRICCDFRRPEELQIEPSRLPASTRIVSVTVNPGSTTSFFQEIAEGGATAEDMAAFMQHINREFVQHHAQPFRRMFEELLQLDDGGFMINCAAGKDRTGFGAAMILAALGVSNEDIVHDYMLSDRYFPIERELERVLRKYGDEAGGNLNKDLIMPMMQVRPEYIRAALQAIEEEYGSAERYLAQMLGVGEAERRLLRERLTA
jgi:protein-tyrosine phosphatase